MFHEGGYWRELIVRTNSQGHTMAIITFQTQELRQEDLNVQKEAVKKFFTTGPGAVYLLGLKICISPDAFFQINTAGAEVLYRTVRELSGVLGIELVEQAVEDARRTAAFNGITNCEFHAGRAEKILPQLLKSKEDGHFIVAVVNPARAGLHSAKKLVGEPFVLRKAVPVDLFPHTLH
ncbi:hypothetical protein GH733_018997, partial [Mirounga leonina]